MPSNIFRLITLRFNDSTSFCRSFIFFVKKMSHFHPPREGERIKPTKVIEMSNSLPIQVNRLIAHWVIWELTTQSSINLLIFHQTLHIHRNIFLDWNRSMTFSLVLSDHNYRPLPQMVYRFWNWRPRPCWKCKSQNVVLICNHKWKRYLVIYATVGYRIFDIPLHRKP